EVGVALILRNEKAPLREQRRLLSESILQRAQGADGLGLEFRKPKAKAVPPPPIAAAAMATFAPVLSPPPLAAAAAVLVGQASILPTCEGSVLPMTPCALSISPVVPLLVCSTAQPPAKTIRMLESSRVSVRRELP